MTVRSPRDSWSVLCQVTHRAQRLAEGYRPEFLESAYAACRSGKYGRLEATPHCGLNEAHASFFGITAFDSLLGSPVRRVVAATEFGPPWVEIREAFVAEPRESISERISGYSMRGAAGREFGRWIGLADDDGTLVAPSVLEATVSANAPRQDTRS